MGVCGGKNWDLRPILFAKNAKSGGFLRVCGRFFVVLPCFVVNFAYKI